MIGWVVDTLLASTLLMLLVLALRGAVRRAFGLGIAYALWLLPVARLVLPPLPELPDWLARLSALHHEAVASINRLGATGIVAGAVNPASLPPVAARQSVVTVTIEAASVKLPIAIVPATPVEGGMPVGLLVLGFWLAGAAAFLALQWYCHHRFCDRLRQRARRQSAIGTVRVIESDAATGPLAFGIWRRYVAFPADFSDRYDADERELALAHELAHHAGGDLIANWIALLVLALHWFNPIAWYAFRAFRADQEMACDARVLARRDPAYRHAYGRAIVKSAHRDFAGGAVSAACHLHTVNDLKGRLRMLSSSRKSRLRLAGGAASVASVALASLALTASGGQAAERLRARVNHVIGVDIAKLDAAVAPAPAAPAIPATPGAVATAAPAAPAIAEVVDDQAPTVPVPPSSAAPVVPPPPPHPDIYVEPPALPAPPAPGDKVERRVMVYADGDREAAGDRHVHKRVRIIRRDRDGHIISDETRDMPDMADIPEVSSTSCGPGAGEDHEPVIHKDKDGKRMIIICTDRIERMANHAAMMAANSKDIERNAYQSALRGLQAARARLNGKSDDEARKGIDEAIAELESDLAKLN